MENVLVGISAVLSNDISTVILTPAFCFSVTFLHEFMPFASPFLLVDD